MKTLHKLILLSFLLSSELYAQGLSCADVGMSANSAAECCRDLSYSAGLCQAPVRPNIIVCSTDPANPTTCPVVNGRNQGCYPQREEDVFPDPADNSPLPENDNDETRLEAGDTCTNNNQCESFECVPDPKDAPNRICKEKLICRHAEVGEEVEVANSCEPGLDAKMEKDENQVLREYCVEPNKDTLPYSSVVDKFINSTGQCTYDIPQGVVAERVVSMRNLRAFEFIFSQVADDNMKLRTYLRDVLMKPFFNEHKKILSDFNKELKKIEDDEKLVKEAKADSTKVVTIHGTEQLMEKEVAIRRASGKDAIKLMLRRNLLSRAYETAMYALITPLAAKVGALSKNVGEWKGKKKTWKIAEEDSWKEVSYNKKKITKAYTSRLRLKPKTNKDNQEALDAANVKSYLSLVGGELPGKKFYLLDAPLPEGSQSFGVPGNQQNNLTGDSANNGLKGIRSSFQEKVKQFYKNLKVANGTASFVYEPELITITTDRKDCIENLSDSSCASTKQFLEEVADTAFAQFIAYSAHKKGKYKKFFEKENTLRRRMLKQMEVDLQNVAKYYEDLTAKRLAMDECYTKAYNHIAQDLNDSDSNNEIGEDTLKAVKGKNADIKNGSLNSLASSKNRPNSGPVDLITADSRKFLTPNLGSTPTLTSTNSNLSSANGSSQASVNTSSSASISDAASGANAVSRRKLAEENKQISARNPSAAEKRAQQVDSAYTALGGTAASAPVSSESALTMASGEFQGLQDEEKKAATDAAAGNVTNNAAQGNRAFKPIVEGNYSGSGGSSSSSEAAVAKTSGMSDEDADVMMANLERTRTDYDGKEEDELFDRVSKAYVRNLDRVLNRKGASSR